MAIRELKLRWPDRCVRCGADLPAGTRARWDDSSRTVCCLLCTELAAAAESSAAPPVVARGAAGASIGREHARRRNKREKHVRDAHPHIGGVLLALSTPPRHEEALRIGEEGEIAVGAALEKAVAQVDGIVLHNRRMPSGRGDIDHIAIVPSGIYVVDAKAVKGKVEIRRPWFRAPELWIAGRDRTKYLDGLDRQAQAVGDAIATTNHAAITIQGALCFTHTNLPWLRAVELRGHLLIYRKALTKRLLDSGQLEHTGMKQLAAAIAHALRPA